MKQIIDNSREIYFSPSFFSEILSSGIDERVHENYLESNFDLYSEIKKYTPNNISSKFREMRYIPLSNGELDYEKDLWDFSSYMIVRYSKRKIHFENVPHVFKNDVKDFDLLLILKGNIKISSVISKHMQLRKFLNFIYRRGIYRIRDIDYDDVLDFMYSLELTKATYGHYQILLEDFFSIYDMEHGTQIFSPKIIELCQRTQFSNRVKAERKHNRRHPIPEEYFDKLISLLYRIMNDINESENTRASAAILLIDSQIGLRASELSLLEVNSIETIRINEKNFRMIHYKIIKTARGGKGYFESVTFINDLSFAAYNVLVDLFSENRKIKGTNLLFCPMNVELPADPSNYLVYLKKVCILYADELDSRNSLFKHELSGVISADKFSKNTLNLAFNKSPLCKLKNVNKDTEFYFPVLHQFRHTVVDRLYKSGVELEYIRRYMGHLCSDMTANYVNFGDSHLKENVDFSNNVLKTYLSGDAEILGGSGKQLMQRIDEWLIQNEYNIQDDLEEVIIKLGKIVPIRAKHGGMCIKGQKITDACSVDSKTDEFFCACGICPNICHFYFMLDVTYSDFQAAIKIYEHNMRNGYTRQSEKEKSKIKHLIVNRLVPEVTELEREISKKGLNLVVSRHPELKEIIDNLDEIKLEVQVWS